MLIEPPIPGTGALAPGHGVPPEPCGVSKPEGGPPGVTLAGGPPGGDQPAGGPPPPCTVGAPPWPVEPDQSGCQVPWMGWVPVVELVGSPLLEDDEPDEYVGYDLALVSPTAT